MIDGRPFTGITVLDVSRILASPFTTGQLALLGAEVIKVEDPGTGDAARHGHSYNEALTRSGMSSNFLAQNANKRSMTLDLRQPEAQEIFRKLAAKADVVVQNLRTGTMDRYGLGYEDLKKIQPRIIYCSLTAYGATGPKKRHPAYDPVVQAASGMMSINGTPETAPLKVGPPAVDYGTGLAAAFAIATALYARERTGEGQHIDVSLLDTAFALMGSVVTDVLTAGATPRAHGNTYASIPTNAAFATKAGTLYIAAMEEHQVRNLWNTIDHPELAQDERFSTLERRTENSAVVRDKVQEAFMKKSASEWEDLLNEAGVPAMRIRTIPEAVREPYVQARNLFHTFGKVPGLDVSVTVPMVPFKLSGCEPQASRPPPMLGAHTDEILLSMGYSTHQLKELRQRKVI